MDFWSRLISGRSLRPSLSSTDLAGQRFRRFQKLYKQIQDITRTTPIPFPPNSSAAADLRGWINQLTSILLAESRAPAPHSCLSYVLDAAIYQDISSLAVKSADESLIVETVGLFSALVESDENAFLSDRRFAHSLMACVDTTRGHRGRIFVNESSDAGIVELLFAVVTNIRLQPNLLDVWFLAQPKDDPDDTNPNQAADTTLSGGFPSQDGFPLCYHLIYHVHHDGPIGDFARTGLLYIFESASRSKGLESWLIDSDLPTLMASGLGALYSQLSRKLSIAHPDDGDFPIILLLSDYSNKDDPSDTESCFSPAFKKHLATFLSYLTLWQDVLENCASADVRESLLDHFRVLFLEQLLYPAMLQSSDMDGGSAIAVLTYLKHIFETLSHPELVKIILVYLLAITDSSFVADPTDKLQIKDNSSVHPRLRHLSADGSASGPSLFSLSDLILNNVRSTDPQTVAMSLRLISVLLQQQHKFVPGSLYRCHRVPPTHPKRTRGGFMAELQEYITIASSLSSDDGWDEAYEGYLDDAYKALECHSCFGYNRTHVSGDFNPPKLHPHTLDQNDPLIATLFRLLDTFLTNDVEVNLCLTQVFISLASCQAMQLDGWLAVSAEHYQFDDTDETASLGSPTLRRIRAARRTPSWSPAHTPAMLRSLKKLSHQISILQRSVPGFVRLVPARRKAFQLYDRIDTGISAKDSKTSSMPGYNTPARPSSVVPPSPSGNSTDAAPVSPVNWLSQRVRDAFDPTASSRSPSRPSSISPTPIRQPQPQSLSGALPPPFIDTTFPPPLPSASPLPANIAVATQAQVQNLRLAFRSLADSMSSLRLGLGSSFDDRDLSGVARSVTPSSSSVIENMMAATTQYPRIPDQVVGPTGVTTTTAAATTGGNLPGPFAAVSGPDAGPHDVLANTRRSLIVDLVNVATRGIRSQMVTFPLDESVVPGIDSPESPSPRPAVPVPLSPRSENDDEVEIDKRTGMDGQVITSTTTATATEMETETKTKTETDPTSDRGTDPVVDPESVLLSSKRTVSVNHVLTNVIVLQDFILEIAATLQARAGLFGELVLVEPEGGGSSGV